jgi:cation diffusion facilitator family transporter
MSGATPLLATAEEDPARGNKDDATDTEGRAQFIIKVSLFVACAWWGFGLYTVISTASLAVLASLVDATIDLAAQGVLLGANQLATSGRKAQAYPVGVARLEPVGVIVCAVLMALASGAVIYDAAHTLWHYYPEGPAMNFTDRAAFMLSVVVVVKIAVWRTAKLEYERLNNVSLEALALDNFNDILSNFSALVFASLTRLNGDLWWMDPVGGILISIYIIRSWCMTAVEQVDMLVGKEAHPDFLSTVREMAESHDPNAKLDIVRAYHFGPKFLVEVELIMDRQTPLAISHDVGISLQDQIERMEECERCFVHVDYQHREMDDHDTTVPIAQKVTTPVSASQAHPRGFFAQS